MKGYLQAANRSLDELVFSYLTRLLINDLDEDDLTTELATTLQRLNIAQVE